MHPRDNIIWNYQKIIYTIANFTKSKIVMMYILPLFLFTYRIRFIINQTWLTLTKSIEKSSTNYTIQHMHYQRIFHGGFNQTNLVLWILLFVSINLVKVCQDWFRTYLIQVNKNRESSVYLWFFFEKLKHEVQPSQLQNCICPCGHAKCVDLSLKVSLNQLRWKLMVSAICALVNI